MADDIARLGLAIDSRPAAEASTALDRLAQTSRKAEDATDGLAAAAEAAGRGLEKAARDSRAARIALDEAAGAARKVEAAAVSMGRAAIAPTMAYVRAIEQANAALRVQDQINRSAGVRGGSDTAARAADIAAYGEALDDLRARFVPLFAAERQHRQTIMEINEAAKVGAISERERAAAIERTTLVYQAQVGQIRQLEGALRAQAMAAKQAAESAVARQTISPNRGADIAAYGAQLDSLRAKFNPLFAAGQEYRKTLQEIDAAAKVGAISERERAAALARTKEAFAQQVTAMSGLARGASLSSFAMMNLGRQIGDIGTMAALGASPFQILASQGEQVYSILREGQGGVGGSLRYIGERLAALVTPARLVVGGLAAIGVAAVAAYASWINAQAEVERSLLGIGRASGATAAQINGIAEAYAGLGRVSTATARQIASSMAATGQISPDLFGDTISVAKNLATTLGVEVPEAAGLMAQALADPSRAVGQLNDRLGAFDAATLRRIQSLDAQNRLSEAQKIIVDRIRSATEGADKATTGWSRILEGISTMISNAWDAVGKAIDDATGRGPLEVQLKQLEAQREAQQKVLDQIRGSFFYSFRAPDAQAALDDLDEKIRKVREELERGAAKAGELRQALASLRLMDAINITLPEINAQKVLNDRAAALRALAGDPDAQRAQDITQEQATLAAQRADEAAKSYLSTQQATTKQMELQNQAITARSPVERANLAYAQRMAELAGSNASESEKREQAQLAYNNALKEGSVALSEQARMRMLTASQAVDQVRLETQLVGATAEQRELAIANLRTEQELIRDAAQNHTAVNQAELDALKQRNAELAHGNQLLREANLISDAAFERRQLGRTSGDQQIASALRSAGMSENLDSDIASVMRLNAEMKDLKDTASSALSGFAQDLMQGVSAAKALSNQLARIADKLIQMAADQLVSAAFGGLLGGGGGGGLGRIDISGGASSIGLFHSGGLVGYEQPSSRVVSHAVFAGAPRFHSGGLALGELPAILQKGEEVLTRDDPRHILNGGRVQRPDVAEFRSGVADMISTTFAPVFNIANGAAQNAAEQRAMMLGLITEWWRSNRRDVVNVVREARAARVKGI